MRICSLKVPTSKDEWNQMVWLAKNIWMRNRWRTGRTGLAESIKLLLREMGYRTVDALADLGTTGRNGLRRGERNKAAGRRKGSKGGAEMPRNASSSRL